MKNVEILVVSKWTGVSFDCPSCKENNLLDVDEFLKDQPDAYFEDWDNVTCPECGEKFGISYKNFD